MITRRQFLYGSLAVALAAVAQTLLRLRAQPNAQVSGQVLAAGGGPVVNARVTLFTPALAFFREARTNGAGNYTFDNVPAGSYRPGACALGREYQEVDLNVSEPGTTGDFSLGLETHLGAWAIVGSTEPETFSGTNSGSLLADGRIFYCHDATDPILFNRPTFGIRVKKTHFLSLSRTPRQAEAALVVPPCPAHTPQIA